ncbi:MAG: FAD:protein FMN transferase [Deltaproteobacteria bacterium]|nr:FAD:protein FMN transferase [Deltaproteobacteria bacterium]
MGNVPVSISVRSEKNSGEVFRAMEESFRRALRIEEEVSEFRPSSQLSLLNKEGAKRWIPIGKELGVILNTGRKISGQTRGAFDMTFASSKKTASYEDVELDLERGRGRLRREGVVIGVSGIAKGYIVDQMSDSLLRQGFREHLVNAGGDLRVRGRWQVGIRDPRHPEVSLCHLTLKNQSVSTSGRYERGDHIVDPRTRTKVRRRDILSTTVVGQSTIETDALATAAFILSAKEMEEFFSQHPELILFIVDSEGKARRVRKGLDSAPCSPYTPSY